MMAYGIVGIPLSIFFTLISFLILIFQLIKNWAYLKYIHFFFLLIYIAIFSFYTYFFLE